MDNPEAVLRTAVQRIEELEHQLLVHQQQLQQASPQRSNQFRARKPSTFSGNKWDANALEAWIQEVDTYFYLTGVPGEQQSIAASSFFVGHAALWWRMKIQNHGLAEVGSWEDLKQDLRQQFKPARAESEARDKLSKLRQKGKLTFYVLKFRELIAQIPNISDDEKLNRFLEGLTDIRMRRELDYRQPENWNEAIQLALRYDSIQNGNSSYDRPSYATPSRRPDAMDLDAMDATPKRVGVRKCYRCGDPNHLVRSCPQRKGASPYLN